MYTTMPAKAPQTMSRMRIVRHMLPVPLQREREHNNKIRFFRHIAPYTAIILSVHHHACKGTADDEEDEGHQAQAASDPAEGQRGFSFLGGLAFLNFGFYSGRQVEILLDGLCNAQAHVCTKVGRTSIVKHRLPVTLQRTPHHDRLCEAYCAMHRHMSACHGEDQTCQAMPLQKAEH